MRSVSASTRASAAAATINAQQTAGDRELMFWLNDVPETSPALKALSDDDVQSAFTLDKCKLLAKPDNTTDEISGVANLSKYDYLTRCKLAQVSEDNQFLTVPNS